jgi:hypothetical protein
MRYTTETKERIYDALSHAQDHGMSMFDAAWPIYEDTGHSVGSIMTVWFRELKPEYLKTRERIGRRLYRKKQESLAE